MKARQYNILRRGRAWLGLGIIGCTQPKYCLSPRIDRLDSENQYLPPKALGQRLPADITPEESVRAWIDLMHTADKLMLARFATEVGRENAEEAYRQWLNEEARKPRPHKVRLARRINSIGGLDVD